MDQTGWAFECLFACGKSRLICDISPEPLKFYGLGAEL
jgi:hypothetical protein